MTGFDPGTFSNNLQILIDYGENAARSRPRTWRRPSRAQKGPLYELTNALTDRNWDQSLFFLDSLLGGEIHALQVLAAIANQVRKLLLAKDFAESTFGAAWHPAGTYPQFQKSGMPAVVQFDASGSPGSKAGKAFWRRPCRKARKGKRPKCPPICSSLETRANPFPVYQVLKKSERFSREDLLRALEALSEADIRLKSSTLIRG